MSKANRPTAAHIKVIAYVAEHGRIMLGSLAPAKGINGNAVNAALRNGFLRYADDADPTETKGWGVLTDAGRSVIGTVKAEEIGRSNASLGFDERNELDDAKGCYLDNVGDTLDEEGLKELGCREAAYRAFEAEWNRCEKAGR